MFRLGPRLLLLSLVCALVASVLQAAPTAASAPDPANDKPKLPASCTREPGGMTYKAGPCYLNKFRRDRPTVVLWGDSHAWQQLPALRPLARQHDVNLVMFMLGGCAPFLVRKNTQQTLYACEQSNRLALLFVRELERREPPVRVLIGAFWQKYRDLYQRFYVDDIEPGPEYEGKDSFLRSIRKFHKHTPRLFGELGRVGVRVDVTGPAAYVPDDPPRCEEMVPYACEIPRKRALPQEGATKRWLGRQLRKVPSGSRMINFNGPYCGASTCFGKVGNIYTFYDIWHLSATRTRTLQPYFERTFSTLG